MNRISLAEYVVPVAVLAPQDITTTETKTSYVKLGGLNECAFLIYFGSITATSADQSITVTLEASSAGTSTSGVLIPFYYRLSEVAASFEWGAVTSATTAGVSIATTDDGKILWIEVDAATVTNAAVASGGGQYVHVNIVPDAGATATLVTAIALTNTAFKATSALSTT